MKRHIVRGRAYIDHCWSVFLTPTVRWGDTVKVGLILGLISNAILAGHLDRAGAYELEVPHMVETVEASEPQPEQPKEVQIEVVYNWTPERTTEEIRKVFVDTPGLAVAIAKCESQFDKQPDLNIQSQHVIWYGQERSFGLFQIHEPAWDKTAKELGLDYKNNPYDNIAMAKYIYDRHGWSPWVCFTKNLYQKHL